MRVGRRPSLSAKTKHGGDHAAKEFEMSSGAIPADPNRPRSNAEKAMSANARSRDRQGKAEDRDRHDRHVGMMDSGAVERVPLEARSISRSRQDAEAGEQARDEGI